MKRSLFLLLLAASLLLASCQAAPTVVPTISVKPAPTSADKPNAGAATAVTGYPVDMPTGAPPAAPGSDIGYPAGVPPTDLPALIGVTEPWLAYPPAPGDDTLVQGTFLVETATLELSPDVAGQADVVVEGSLPTPCNKLRAKVNAPTAQKQITVEVYSVTEKDVMCTDVIQPYTGIIATLGGYPAGKYTVMVNEIKAGELTVP